MHKGASKILLKAYLFIYFLNIKEIQLKRNIFCTSITDQSFANMSVTHKFKSTIFIITIFINDILSFPFEFPKSGISFSSSDETDEYKDIRRCLNEEEYSMPFFDPQTNEVYS